MDVQKIKRLTEEWEDVTDKVIRFMDPGCDRIRGLFRETFDLLDRYSESDFVPKELCKLLLEMHDFMWWSSDLEETPMHRYYGHITDIVYGLNSSLFVPIHSPEEIIKMIDEIV